MKAIVLKALVNVCQDEDLFLSGINILNSYCVKVGIDMRLVAGSKKSLREPNSGRRLSAIVVNPFFYVDL